MTAAAIVAGCSEEAIAPATRVDEAHEIAGPPMLLEDPDPLTTVSFATDGGVQYTLNMSTQQVVGSDGSILVLTAEQAAAMLSAFHGTLIADEQAADLVAAASESGGGPACDPYDPENPCEQVRSVGGPVRTDWTAAAVRRVSIDGRRLIGKRFGLFMTPRSPAGRDTPRPGGDRAARKYAVSGEVLIPGGPSFLEPDICTDILNAVLPTTVQYASVRNSFMSQLISVAVAEILNGAWVRVVPSGSFAALVLETQLAEHMNARIAVGIVGAMWNMYECGSRNVTGGPVLRLGAGQTGGGAIVCHYETWEISFDGGQTSTDVQVRVCEYVAE
jgi:hypothetical protein